MTDTQQKILKSAEECFFQYGYSKANMSLVSQYSGISRVTIHKHFKNKEGLFRSVVDSCLTESMAEATQSFIDNASEDCWFNIENYMLRQAKPVFDNIKDSHVLMDLNNAVNEITYDILYTKKVESVEFIANQLTAAQEKRQIDLAPLKMTPYELGWLLKNCFSGLFMYAPLEELKIQMHSLIRVYKHATLIKE